MKVLHIARWCSARVYKQVLAQQWAGWNVTLMAAQTPHPELHAMVGSAIGWCTPGALSSLARAYDTVVVHTTISTHSDATMISIAIAHSDCRTVWDCHDYCGLGPAEQYDAVTCPSMGMAAHFGERGVVVYSKVPDRLWPTRDDSRLIMDAVVFQGTMGNGEAWADYSGLEERLGRPVFFFPSADNVQGHEGCRIMKRLPYVELLDALQYYAAGYAGAANERVSIHDCVTNKFWEYAAAGLPVLTYNSSEMTGILDIDWVRDTLVMESELGKMKEAYGL